MSEPDLRDSLEAVANPPVYSGNVMLDQLYDMVLRLTRELAVTREEVALLREALARQGGVDPALLEQISTSPEFTQARLAGHAELVKQVLGDLPGS